MADMNKCIKNGDLQDFCLENNLIDTVGLLNLLKPMTRYMYTAQNVLIIFITPSLMAAKVGHHKFDQHFVSDQKGVYLQFLARDLFDNKHMNRSHESYP